MVRMRLSETDEIAVELYLVPPARFVAARDKVVRQARAAGHRDLAREVSALRRPTLSAWLVNALVRHQHERMRQLFALGRDLRQAQTRLEGDRLRRLPAQREDLIAELLDWARGYAAEAGVRPTEAALAEVEATLQAGLVDLGAAAAVMSGHLVRPMSHAGFGPLPQVEPAGGAPPEVGSAGGPPPQVEPAGGRPPRVGPAGGRPPQAGPDVAVPSSGAAGDELAEWRVWPVDELGRRRERTGAADRPDRWDTPPAVVVAQYDRPPADPAQSLRRAEADLAEAASDHWQREHDLAEAEAAMQAVKDRQELLEQQRMQLRRDKAAAEQDLAAARAAQRAALRALTDARRALEAAEKQIAPDDPE